MVNRVHVFDVFDVIHVCELVQGQILVEMENAKRAMHKIQIMCIHEWRHNSTDMTAQYTVGQQCSLVP